MNLNQLSVIFRQTNEILYQQAIKAVNMNLTLRNWLFGYYIVEFEQNGDDYARYGKSLLQNLAKKVNIKGLSAPELSRCRQFYQSYPRIFGTVSQDFMTSVLKSNVGVRNFGTVSQKSQLTALLSGGISLTHDELQGEKANQYQLRLLQCASYNHFVELIKINDNTKRNFYELLILKTTPSIRELRRSIQTLTYERFGLSGNQEIAIKQLQKKIQPETSADLVKSHYVFDFLKISQPHLIEEKELEQALISHLQEFILELGNGFCFEARQKRILIDDEYFFIDLVFYHRILKCHVLIELKTEQAKHEHIGQLKVYLQHYKHQIKAPDDNPPVGILLVTDKNKTMVEYAIADSDKKLFVSLYQLRLPTKVQLESFINQELKKHEI